MGALGAFIVALFSVCFRKLKTRSKTVARLVVLLIIAATILVVEFVADIGDDWMMIALYTMLFGCRAIADIIQIIRNKFEPPGDESKK